MPSMPMLVKKHCVLRFRPTLPGAVPDEGQSSPGPHWLVPDGNSNAPSGVVERY